MQTKLKHYFYYPYEDVHRALVGTLTCLTAFIICRYSSFSHTQDMWLVLFAILSSIPTKGVTKYQQSIGIILLALLSAIFVPLMIWMHNALHAIPFWLVATPIFFGLLSLPRWLPQLAISVLILLVFLVIAISLSQNDPLLLLIINTSLPIFVSMLFLLFWNAVLPLSISPVSPVDISSYFFKRNLRLSIALPISFLLAHWLHLQHANWICYSVILVSQANFGATIRKSFQRLAGTLLGVIVGVPISVYIFSVYPWSHWLAFILLFALLVCAIRFYYIAIFMATLLIAASYYILLPSHIGPAAYVLYRLLDTFLGVILAILLEIILFRKSALSQVRDEHAKFWDAFYTYIKNAMENRPVENIKTQLAEDVILLQDAVNDMRYEPIGQLTLRFRMASALFNDYIHLQTQFMAEEIYTKENEKYLIQILSYIKQIADNISHPHHLLAEMLLPINEQLEKLCQEMKRHHVCNELQDACNYLLTLLQLFHAVVTTPRWHLYHTSVKSPN